MEHLKVFKIEQVLIVLGVLDLVHPLPLAVRLVCLHSLPIPTEFLLTCKFGR